MAALDDLAVNFHRIARSKCRNIRAELFLLKGFDNVHSILSSYNLTFVAGRISHPEDRLTYGKYFTIKPVSSSSLPWYLHKKYYVLLHWPQSRCNDICAIYATIGA